jgi:hypothetical protein
MMMGIASEASAENDPHTTPLRRHLYTRGQCYTLYFLTGGTQPQPRLSDRRPTPKPACNRRVRARGAHRRPPGALPIEDLLWGARALSPGRCAGRLAARPTRAARCAAALPPPNRAKEPTVGCNRLARGPSQGRRAPFSNPLAEAKAVGLYAPSRWTAGTVRLSGPYVAPIDAATPRQRAKSPDEADFMPRSLRRNSAFVTSRPAWRETCIQETAFAPL